jgi:hypothetical protein
MYDCCDKDCSKAITAITIGLLLLCMPLAYAQDAVVIEPLAEALSLSTDEVSPPSEPPQPESSPPPDQTVDTSEHSQLLSWDIRIDNLVQDDRTFAAGMENPDELYAELGQLLQIRLRQFEMVIDDARSRDELADPHKAALAAIFPAANPAWLMFPDYVVTVQDVHENFLGLYRQRIRLLDYVSADLKMQIKGTDLYGMQQLYFEFSAIWQEMRYQGLRIPAAGEQILRMATRAPLPLVWFLIELLVFVLLFRWWRRWFPETLQRMQSYLLAIRPRTPEIVQRMRALWYIQQVRLPLEWLVFFQLLLGLIGFLQLELISAISEIFIQWVFLSWFVVEFVDAFVARGAGGAASDLGKTRLSSLRWLAAWLVLLGLGLELADRLAGEAALHALVWRSFQLLAFPLAFIQLRLWRKQLFYHVEREDPDFMSREEFLGQRGLAKYTAALRLLGFLAAAWPRKILFRSLEQFGTSRGVAMAASKVESRPDDCVDPALSDLLLAGEMNYTKYARTARRQLIERINNGLGGSVVIVGERGIGKESFMYQVCDAVDSEYLLIDCASGKAAEVERQIADGLGINGPLSDKQALAQAVTQKNIRLIALRNLHLLARPVVGGLEELAAISKIFDLFPEGVARILTMDLYAWQYIRRALSERAASLDVIELSEWSDEQIVEFLEDRREAAGLDVDFSQVRVPSQYLDATEDPVIRNRKGIFTMAARLAGGNPAIALRLFARSIRKDSDGNLYGVLPANRDSRQLESASLHVMLVLRVIAQAEYISHEHIVANLRYPVSVVNNALQYSLENKWIVEENGVYSLRWGWFQTITRVLSRQNLLAGVR